MMNTKNQNNMKWMKKRKEGDNEATVIKKRKRRIVIDLDRKNIKNRNSKESRRNGMVIGTKRKRRKSIRKIGPSRDQEKNMLKNDKINENMRDDTYLFNLPS